MKIIEPFGERVLVRVIVSEEQEGSLLVTPTDKDSSNKGIVEAVGEGMTLQDGTIKPLRVKVGDKVLFNLNAGTKIYDNTEIYRVINSRDILGKLIEEN